MGLLKRQGYEATAFLSSDDALEGYRVGLAGGVKSRHTSKGERAKCRLALDAVLEEQQARADWNEAIGRLNAWQFPGDDDTEE